MRSDAVQNRASLVRAARRALGSTGGQVSQEEIAGLAGVGVATLYRHFPKREDLVAAVFEQIVTDDLEPVLEEAKHVPPVEALRLLFERVLTLLSAEQGLLAAAGNFAAVTDQFVRSFLGRLGTMLLRAQEAHQIRADLTVDDLLPVAVMLISTVATTGAEAAVPDQNWRRYLDLVFDALTTPAPSPLPPRSQNATDLLSIAPGPRRGDPLAPE